MGNVTALT